MRTLEAFLSSEAATDKMDFEIPSTISATYTEAFQRKQIRFAFLTLLGRLGYQAVQTRHPDKITVYFGVVFQANPNAPPRWV